MEKFADELRQSIIAIAGERLPVDTRESWLRRAARRAGITYGEAKRLFYREMPNPRAWLVERVRAAIAAKHKEKENAMADDLRNLSHRIGLMEQRLSEVRAQLDCRVPLACEIAALVSGLHVTSD